MRFKDVVILLPCQSLEDLSLERDADDAEELLSAWSAPFHPAVLSAVGSIPGWIRAEQPPEKEDLAESLIILPRSSEPMLPDGWLEMAAGVGACLIRDRRDRDRMVAAILDKLDCDTGGLDPELVGDLHALGFCHFQVELLTRQLRYMSSLDEDQFQAAAVAAADAVVGRDNETARERLQTGFDLLTEAREYFYPVESYLLDLTLVASTTLGESLDRELAGRVPSNLLISGGVVDQMARRRPGTLAALRTALDEGKASIIGGEFDERAVPLLSLESILSDFQRGLETYQKHLGHRPEVFGRRRFGLSPVLPQLLEKLEFVGLLHFTLDGGRFPTDAQSKICWEGVDNTTLESLARIPVDASRPDSFMKLPAKLGDVMDLDHTATAVFAHWPGQASRWYDDLKRMDRYSPVLGRFTSIDQFFHDTQGSGQAARYDADQYRAPYLVQAVTRQTSDPISRWVRYHRRRAAADALQTLGTIVELIGRTDSESKHPGDGEETFCREIEDALTTASDAQHDLDQRLSRRLQQVTARCSSLLPRSRTPPERGYLVINPWSFTRSLCLDVSDLPELPATEGPVRAAGESDGRKHAAVDVPAMGFAWVSQPGQSGREPAKPGRKRWFAKKRREPPLAEHSEQVKLRNEHFEVTIDPATGAIRAINDYRSRGNRLSQQLAFRSPGLGSSGQDTWGGHDGEQFYSVMAADEVSVTSPGPVIGEILSRGRLVDRRGGDVATFVQTMRVRRGSRVLELDIELKPERTPEPDPWNSYYAVRFAWNDATANLYRSLSLTSQPSDGVQLEAPHFIDIRSEKVRTTILTAGLPYHRRFGLRKIDSLLIVSGETARRFRLGVGIDLQHPVPAALGFLASQSALAETAAAPSSQSGWLFHLGARNVLATRWESLSSGGRVSGFRARLLETEGRRTQLTLRCFRPINSAHKIDLSGKVTDELPVQHDCITIAIGAYEWVQVEGRFK